MFENNKYGDRYAYTVPYRADSLLLALEAGIVYENIPTLLFVYTTVYLINLLQPTNELLRFFYLLQPGITTM